MNNFKIFIILGLFLGVVQITYGNTIKREGVNWKAVDAVGGLPKTPPTVELRPKNKTVAITLAVTLGVFGVHRLYLGTSNKVPIIYTLTLGGGFGVLMVSDIVAIIAAPDINSYSPSEKVFMWAK